jgi:hypothetical protein
MARILKRKRLFEEDFQNGQVAQQQPAQQPVQQQPVQQQPAQQSVQ